MESHLQMTSKKRGGAKLSPIHVGLMLLCTVLLTLAGIFLVYGMNVLGVLTMILGIAVRVVDTRIS